MVAAYNTRVPGFHMLRSHEHQRYRVQPMYDWRSRVRQVFVLLLSLCATAYFSHHAIHGRHGLEARSALLERTDLVEELARDVLGYVHPADRVIMSR